MTETSGGNRSPAPAQEPGEAQHASLRTTAMICYGLYLLAFFTGLTAIIGVIIAYIKKPDAVGTVWESHFRNLIVAFWVMFAVFLVGLVAFPVSLLSMATLSERDFTWPEISALALPMVVWIFVFCVVVIWFLYRMIRGLIRTTEDRAF